MNAIRSGYDAARAQVAWIDRSARGRLIVTGADRARFLHNLVTNEVKRLPEGAGCEAFVTSLQGKTLGFVTLLVSGEQILVRTDPDALAGLMPHFTKYGALDDVTLQEATSSTFELHFAGPRAVDLVTSLGAAPPAEAALSHNRTSLADRPVQLIRESPAGVAGLTAIGAWAERERVVVELERAGPALGLCSLDESDFDALRIEAGTPVFGWDVTDENLPQEVGRDAQAINFVKGCYLGQETVARLDALGHVNKILKGLRLAPGDPVPPAGTPLLLPFEPKTVGVVTSSAFSPGWNAPVLLAYVRVAHAHDGTALALEVDGVRRTAIVCDLPMQPPAAP